MFASLKSKIKEETGSDLAAIQRAANNNNNNRIRSRFPSTMSIHSETPAATDHNVLTEELCNLRSQCNELTTKVTELTAQVHGMQEEKSRLDKTNEILLETVKVAQTQKDIYCEDQEKIQNLQQHEIDKLKSLLAFREQEAVDRLTAMHQHQQQVENLTIELERLKPLEPMCEDLKDELQQLHHATQHEKSSLSAKLAAAEEEKKNLRTRVQIMEQARLDVLPALKADEKFQAFMQERKLLEQHLEEAHLQLSDIKSSWSGTNLALETQVSRLSKQVAEETTEKRKALKAKDDLIEKVKQLEFDLFKVTEDMQQHNVKIKLLEEEIDELNSALKECREQSDQQVVFERNKAEVLETESNELKRRLERLESANERCEKDAADSDSTNQALRQQNGQLQKDITELQNQLEMEKDEKLMIVLKNAEISQSEAMLQKELKLKQQEGSECKLTLEKLRNTIRKNEERLKEVDTMQREISEKNKAVKMLNQRLTDLKKTLHKELHHRASSSSIIDLEIGQHIPPTNSNLSCAKDANCTCGATPNGAIIMDEVNFKYLKHVIVKFLTSREVEARHLIRAVATLLQLSKEEEQLLHDTINWKMSWFGSKPDHGTGQLAFSIPPS